MLCLLLLFNAFQGEKEEEKNRKKEVGRRYFRADDLRYAFVVYQTRTIIALSGDVDHLNGPARSFLVCSSLLACIHIRSCIRVYTNFRTGSPNFKLE